MKRHGGLVVVCVVALLVVAGVAGADVTKAPAILKAGNFGTIASHYEAQNSPQDRLVVQVTAATEVNGKWVSKLLVIWGDLDDLIKSGNGYYSPWPGSVDLGSATGKVIGKYHFNEGPGEPRVGSGRDKLVTASGSKIEWKAAVTGCYDGLLIEITSDTATTPVKVAAGAFTFDAQIAPASGSESPQIVNVAPASSSQQPVAAAQQVQVSSPAVAPAGAATATDSATQVQVSTPAVTASGAAAPAADTPTNTAGVGIKQLE